MGENMAFLGHQNFLVSICKMPDLWDLQKTHLRFLLIDKFTNESSKLFGLLRKLIKKFGKEKMKMDEKWIGFIVWCAVGVLMIGIGICALFSKKPVNFWANANIGEVNHCKRYNCAVAKLFCLYGIVFIVLGIPLLAGQNSAWILLSVVGVMIESIMAMAVYTLVIEKKYKKR